MPFTVWSAKAITLTSALSTVIEVPAGVLAVLLGLILLPTADLVELIESVLSRALRPPKK